MNEPTTTSSHGLVPTRMVERIVEIATRAPSVHNTQPWRWRASAETLELYADRTRQLLETDPLGRNLTISCGAALHHAQVAAAALGWATEVVRLPDPARPDLLARLRLSPAAPPVAALDTLEALDRRCTDRRRFTAWPVPEDRLAHLARIGHEWGARAVPLTDESERYIAERLVLRAADLQRTDRAAAKEQQAWRDRSAVDGVPSTVLPGPAALRGAHPHRFETPADQHPVPGDLDVEPSDGLLVLFDTTDDPRAWLRAGEGLGALWLAATAGGLSVVPLTQVIEVPETRMAMQKEVLGGLAHPLILVRIGWQSIGGDELPRTPRRPVAEVLEMVRRT
jgi:nitroreductase